MLIRNLNEIYFEIYIRHEIIYSYLKSGSTAKTMKSSTFNTFLSKMCYLNFFIYFQDLYNVYEFVHL